MDPILSLKNQFFDRDKVVKAMDAATRKTLSRFGAFVRQRARTSMKRKAGSSPPGSPPFAHAGQLRDLLFFVYDPQRKSVVIGPAALRSKTGVPALLEAGGTVQRPSAAGGRRPARYAARPYMTPAFEAEKGKLADQFRGSLRV